jgi:hypothetical protein
VRVWSTDWFDNPSKETDKLVAKLEQLRVRPVSAIPSYPPLHRASAVVDPEEVEEAAKTTSREPPSLGEPTLGVVKPALPPSTPDPAFDGTSLLKGTDKLTHSQAVAALEAYRDKVIAPASENWEPERSLLRPAMIETFVKQRITDPNQWYVQIPQFLRQGTSGTEKKRYLEDVCALVERLQ